ncbi:MAG: hypothetical protein R3E73_14610 [Porticoccaceae bacterium]|nr:hypothetical protein [Pseudomonadales bacterium]MCP5173407.1 hypothetical protein [Pseudomonadales bacterium]MCP5303219.1 hypothetical protein [Pseudomonadales bacterium]
MQPDFRDMHLTVIAVFASVLLTACSGTTIKTTTLTPLQQQTTPVEESQLLDVGVIPFDPGLDNIDEDDSTTLPEIRNAESSFFANQLTDTIQNSAAWGAVRVVPGKQTVMDVYVQGTILRSDGETLELEITATDTSGKEWFKKKYEEQTGKYAYERHRDIKRDPFQGLFNRIANDLLAHRNRFSATELELLRTISSLRFARAFSPDAFSDHMTEDKKGILKVQRLPAQNDPILRRIERIRERDYLFVDTLQEHYDAFSRRMTKPYQEWRAASYEEVLAIEELKRQSRNRTIAGVAAVLVGVAAAGGGDRSTRAAGAVAVGAGGLLIKSGLNKKAEVQLHVESLIELGQSLETEIEPRVIELEDRTITLTGNVEAQYEQWKQILSEIYQTEHGGS